MGACQGAGRTRAGTGREASATEGTKVGQLALSIGTDVGRLTSSLSLLDTQSLCQVSQLRRPSPGVCICSHNPFCPSFRRDVALMEVAWPSPWRAKVAELVNTPLITAKVSYGLLCCPDCAGV